MWGGGEEEEGLREKHQELGWEEAKDGIVFFHELKSLTLAQKNSRSASHHEISIHSADSYRVQPPPPPN